MSKAFDIKKRVIELAKADPAFADMAAIDAIWDSAYNGQARPRHVLWFGEILWEGVDQTTIGRPGSRDEIFNIRFGIEIHDGDQTQTEANDKAEAYLDSLEDMLADHRAVAIPGIITLRIVPVGLGEGQDPSGRVALLAAQVNVKVRN